MEPHCNENEPEKQKRVRRDARFAPRVGRQMRLDLRKLRFRQPKLVATHLCLLFGSRESRHYVRANTFMGPDPNGNVVPKHRRLVCSKCGGRNVRVMPIFPPTRGTPG